MATAIATAPPKEKASETAEILATIAAQDGTAIAIMAAMTEIFAAVVEVIEEEEAVGAVAVADLTRVAAVAAETLLIGAIATGKSQTFLDRDFNVIFPSSGTTTIRSSRSKTRRGPCRPRA